MASGPDARLVTLETPESLEPAGLPASYGQACINCSRAKYRCIYRTDGLNCERCHRLKKECVPSSSVRKLASRRAVGSRGAHVRHLEDKIEELVALLRNQSSNESNTNGIPDGTGILTPASTIQSLRSRGVTDEAFAGEDDESSRSPSISKPIDGPNRLLTSYFDQPSLITSSFEPDPSQAEECLLTFRNQMLSFFPFVYLPSTMTAKQVRESSPFLWFNIMAVTARTANQQFAMSDSIKRFLAQKLVVDNEKNLDLLLGLLVFICWFHFHRKDRSYISVMASLAGSLIYDMGLNKALAEPTATPCGKDNLAPLQRARTMAERRAVLSYFFLTSQAAYIQKKIDALEWTPHMDECLQMIAQCPEWPGDEQLATQVKIQLIAEQIRRGPGRSQDYLSSVSFSRTLQAQLEKIKTQLSTPLSQISTITNQLLYAELVIQDDTLAKSPSSTFNPNIQRHQLLNNHLETIIRWFDLFFAVPLDLYSSTTFAFWCHMAHCLMLLYRLYVLEDPAWDRAAVRARLDLFALCDRLAAILDDTAARRMSGQHAEEDMFVKFAKMVRSMRNGWLSEVQATDWRDNHNYQRQSQSQDLWLGQGQGLEVNAGLAGGLMPTMSIPMTMTSDDAWLQDIFNVSF